MFEVDMWHVWAFMLGLLSVRNWRKWKVTLKYFYGFKVGRIGIYWVFLTTIPSMEVRNDEKFEIYWLEELTEVLFENNSGADFKFFQELNLLQLFLFVNCGNLNFAIFDWKK